MKTTTRQEAKVWMADYLESFGVCSMLPERPGEVVKASRRLQFRASRHRGDGSLYITESSGEWSGYYKPVEDDSAFTLVAFGFGNPAGRIGAVIHFDKIVEHFASDLGMSNNSDE